MTITKRIFSFFCAFALCAVLSLGSLSFASTPSTTIDSPVYFDFNPLPVGFFDGDMTSDTQSITLNFNNLSDNESGGYYSNNDFDATIPQHITWTDNLNTLFISGSFYDENMDSFIIPGSYYNTSGGAPNIDLASPRFASEGDFVTDGYTVSIDGSVNGVTHSSHDYSGTVTGSVAEEWDTDKRWYSWWVAIGVGYVWFCTDARNTVNSYVTKVNDDQFTYNTYIDGGHRAFCVICGLNGSVSRTVDNGPGTDGSLGRMSFASTLNSKELRVSQGSSNNNWGFAQSDYSPGLKGFGSLTPGKTFLRTVLFGKDSLEFLMWQQNHSDLVSLQQSIANNISSQTSAIQNMDAPSATQPDTSDLVDYFGKASVYDAPSTDSVFQSQISSSRYWSGVTWWTQRFNDLIVANDIILAFTTAMLTLGLAVLVIGRRVSTR